jgi:hypothetical protein
MRQMRMASCTRRPIRPALRCRRRQAKATSARRCAEVFPALSSNGCRPESRGQLTPTGPVWSGSAAPAPPRPAGIAA